MSWVDSSAELQLRRNLACRVPILLSRPWRRWYSSAKRSHSAPFMGVGSPPCRRRACVHPIDLIDEILRAPFRLQVMTAEIRDRDDHGARPTGSRFASEPSPGKDDDSDQSKAENNSPRVEATRSAHVEKPVMASKVKRTSLRSWIPSYADRADRGLALVESRSSSPSRERSVGFRHALQCIDDPPRHEPEVSGVSGSRRVREAAQHSIEHARRGALEPRLALTLYTLSIDDISAVIHQAHHLRRQLRQILQIGVQYQNAIAARGCQPCAQRHLVSHVASCCATS